MSDEFIQSYNISNIVQKNWKMLDFKSLKLHQEHSRYRNTLNN